MSNAMEGEFLNVANAPRVHRRGMGILPMVFMAETAMPLPSAWHGHLAHGPRARRPCHQPYCLLCRFLALRFGAFPCVLPRPLPARAHPR